MNLFTSNINSFSDWGNIFQDIEIWQPLIQHVFKSHKLPFYFIENLTLGTNAVFKVGNFVIKIFAPAEAGIVVGTNFDTELYGIKRANALSIPSPKLIASGVLNDKYKFEYMIMDYINALPLGDVEENWSYDDKVTVGQTLRIITDRLNTQCEQFDPVNILENAIKYCGWSDYPDSFNKERINHIKSLCIEEEQKVYCHGDLNPDNIFVDKNMNLCLIDFADAVYAPVGYEQALIACEFFCFEKPYMIGYFGNYSISDIVDLCCKWLPVHDSGEHTLRCNIGPAKEITSFTEMRKRLFNIIKSEKEKV